MSNETSKCQSLRKKESHFDLYLKGKGIDIGCGEDKLIVEQGTVDAWDLNNGDAMLMEGIANETYDFVYSSHCLEHTQNVEITLYNWSRILKKDGYLYFVIPEFVLYERMTFPSIFNYDHKQTFSYYITKEQIKRNNHFYYLDLLEIMKNLNLEIVLHKLQDDNYDYDKGDGGNQTRGNALAQILFIAKKTKETPVSQMGVDDLVLKKYDKGFFLDVGCFDGEFISNTYKLEKHGWEGLCIDAFPKNFEKRPRSKVVQAVLGTEKNIEVEFTKSKYPEISGITNYLSARNWEYHIDEKIKMKTSILDEILQENNVPQFIEYMNLDVEGMEFEILKSFPFNKYKFGILSIEHNYQEPKRTEIKNLLEKNGYKLEKEINTDDVYVFDHDVGSKKNYKIGLCMIVKNESKVIERCLNSVKPLIDYVSIVDTGSTDNTIEIINNWMNKNQVDGFVYKEPWKNFAYNRSSALEKLRKNKNVEYALMIDADEVLTYEENINFEKIKESLKSDLYNIKCKFGGIEYERTSITKNNMKYFYKGVVHEFLECEEPIKTRELLAGVINVPLQDSARNQTGKKYDQDVELLQKALKEETDEFMKSRYTFYLAQSYKDNQDLSKAIYWYEQRAKMGFWREEIYISLYQAAKCKELLEYPHDDIIQSYLRAYETCPERIEALHGAISFCRRNGRCNQAFLMAKHARTIPVNKKGLFVESWIWDYGIDDEFSIICYWINNIKEGIEVTEKLLEKIPESQKNRIMTNLQFLKNKLK